MTAWRPGSDAATAARRAQLFARARQYFAARDVLAVDTPSLSRYALSDPNIDSFSAHSRHGGGYFLHTSPEFCMKRLLAAGYPDIYSICRVYRDGEAGHRHLPEFTMLEWYRHDFGLQAMVADTLGLIAAAVDRPGLVESAEVLDYADVMYEHAGVDVFLASADELAERAGADTRLREAIGERRDAWLDLLMGTVVAPRLASDRLTAITHYPATQAALARLCPDDTRVADRFEVFYGDMELANGYVELTDAAEQRRRIDAELELRKSLGMAVAPWDPSLVAALAAGLPACAGVALGLERLHMVMDGAADIREVVTFATEFDND